jgi:hypothetical protein
MSTALVNRVLIAVGEMADQQSRKPGVRACREWTVIALSPRYPPSDSPKLQITLTKLAWYGCEEPCLCETNANSWGNLVGQPWGDVTGFQSSPGKQAGLAGFTT